MRNIESSIETVIHEIAHTFGAFHLDASCVVMKATTSRGYCANEMRFHDATRKVILANKSYDFSKDIRQLSQPTISMITRLYETYGVKETCHPVAKEYQNLGDIYVINEKIDRSMAFYSRSFLLDQSCTGSGLQLALRYITQGKPAEAQKLLERALLFAPNDYYRSKIHVLLAKAHVEKRDTKKAQNSLRKSSLLRLEK